MISIIAAIDSKRGLGKNNDLLFKIPEDFKRMQKITMGHPIIMGRRTFESIGRVLPGRTNIVITRDPSMYDISIYDASNLFVVASLEEAIHLAKEKEREATPLRPADAKALAGKQGSEGQSEIIIFGGGQIFAEAIEKNLVDVLHLTVVEGDFGADTFFPDYSKYKEIKREERSDKDYKFTFLDLAKS